VRAWVKIQVATGFHCEYEILTFILAPTTATSLRLTMSSSISLRLTMSSSISLRLTMSSSTSLRLTMSSSISLRLTMSSSTSLRLTMSVKKDGQVPGRTMKSPPTLTVHLVKLTDVN